MDIGLYIGIAVAAILVIKYIIRIVPQNSRNGNTNH